MIIDLSTRKNIRLKNYDYSSNGMYFVTICCRRGGALLHPIIELSNIGEIISEQWYELKSRYQNILLDQFVVMPNHIHGIIVIDNEQAEQSPAPTIGNIVCAYKSITTKLSNKKENFPGRIIWQRGYYDHIIRYKDELRKIREYIQTNPLKWEDDKYYT